MLEEKDRAGKVKTVMELLYEIDDKYITLVKNYAASADNQKDLEEGKRWSEEIVANLLKKQSERIVSFAELEDWKSGLSREVDINLVSSTSDDTIKKSGGAGGATNTGSKEESSEEKGDSINLLESDQDKLLCGTSGLQTTQSSSNFPSTTASLGIYNVSLPSGVNFSQTSVVRHRDSDSVSTTSSVRRKREENLNRRLDEEIARHRTEIELTQKTFKYQIERIQREKDEEIRRLNEQLELNKLQTTLQSYNEALANMNNDDDDVSLQDFGLADGPGPSTSQPQASRVENWLNSANTFASTPNRRVNFYTDAQPLTTNALQTPVPTAHVSQTQGFSAFPTMSSYTTTAPGRWNGPNSQATTLDRSLPKLKLSEFNGDPLDWPEWSGMFLSTIGKSNISSDEKMSHLKTLLTGPAKRALSGMGYSGAMFDTAWRTLQRKFGQPHVIVSTQLAKLNDFPQIKIQDSKSLVDFADIVSNFINVLSQFGYNNDIYSSSNLETAVLKLPIDVQRRWYAYVEMPRARPQLPNLLMFNDWLQQESLVYERLAATKKSDNAPQKTDKRAQLGQKKPGYNQTFGATEKPSTSDTSKCPLDGENHRIWKCEVFRKKNVNERYDTVKKLKLCFACLSSAHQIKDCKARVCGIDGCEKHHNRLLHQNAKPKADEIQSTSLATDFKAETKGLLQVVTVRVYGPDNEIKDVEAICDTGSSKTWIDQSLTDELNLDGENVTLHVAGIHGTSPLQSKRVTLKLGTTNGKTKIEVKANNHDKIDVGNSVYDIAALKKRYSHLSCIKQNIIELEKVKIILGQDCYSLIRPLEYRKGSTSTPWAVRTLLGWTISGPVMINDKDNCANTSVTMTSDFELGEQVRKWWEMESYGTRLTASTRSIEDIKATAVLEATAKSVGDRYEVGLLWDDSKNALPNNYVSALGQLRSLEARLKRDNSLRQKYEETIHADLAKGYIRKVPLDELMRTKHMKQWYLPHHAVMHPHKPGKVRRVCNAASKYKGLSLNDCLLTGPDLLNNLIGILFRFREHPFAVSADIEAMFMQVLVPEDDQRCLRFLWRDDEGKVVVYQYTRHVFGAKSSPTCVIFVLRKCAEDNVSQFPRAAQVVLTSFYVDDLLNSWMKQTEAKQDCDDVRTLLTKGGFQLDKWVSNDNDLARAICPDDEQGTTKETTVLGLKWNHESDVLEVCRGIRHNVKDRWTQRQVLSVVSSVFDPMGIISPFVITARLILKEIWQTQGQQWDSFISDELNERFKRWLDQLNDMQTIQIQRCYCKDKIVTSRQVHLFADASQEAFCAVGYLRTELEDGSVMVSYLIGKCRVAPKKFQTIPKLELMAALIATRLKDVIVREHRIQFTSIRFWTDSTTVLQWISNHTSKHPVFVANRLAEIMDSTSIDQWSHVPGTSNPADLGTRGLESGRDLTEGWLTGPAWLQLPESEWPQTFVTKLDEDTTMMVKEQKEPLFNWKRFSSFVKLRNIVAWILRWKYKTDSITLNVSELKRAESKLWRLVQFETFAKEMHLLEKESQLPGSSNITKLLPFLDQYGILRAQGRLRKSTLDYDAKHPIILKCAHHVCKLFLEFIHRKYHHEGVEYLRSVVQTRYWILGLRNALRSVKHQCIDCKRAKAATFEPTMADLPSNRVSMKVHPFQHTGVDYFGPFEVRLLRRTLKRWVCLFTCMTTRAVHLEVVHSLDTESCMTAVKRFVARRGLPSTILSDNGTNFVGAQKQFKEMMKQWNRELIISDMAQKGIDWRFNPPSAPHFGGAWERLVRACKKTMFQVLGKQVLTDEVLLTVMTSVEQILNNRPITANSSDPEDLEALTPNHFMIGRASVDVPSYISGGTGAINLKRSFKAAEQCVQSIWDRWMKEYLPQLLERRKWTKMTENPRQGTMVWVLDNKTKRGHYPLGRIQKLHYGDDGIARSAVVKTATGTYERPLVKLAPLMVDVFNDIDENRAGDVGAHSD